MKMKNTTLGSKQLYGRVMIYWAICTEFYHFNSKEKLKMVMIRKVIVIHDFSLSLKKIVSLIFLENYRAQQLPIIKT